MSAAGPVADLGVTRKECGMKLWLSGLALLAGCSHAVSNTFLVDAASSPDVVATLAICGKETPLERRGPLLATARPITCEGHGEVRILLADGRISTCPVGYVTPGLKQEFRFRLHDGICE
jgi:hypothetical protein